MVGVLHSKPSLVLSLLAQALSPHTPPRYIHHTCDGARAIVQMSHSGIDDVYRIHSRLHFLRWTSNSAP